MFGRDKLDRLVEAGFKTMEDETPADATLGACLLICEVRVDGATAFYLHSTDRRGWIQRALLEEAANAQVVLSDAGPEG